ncbi:hypothetical protein DAPPUDRAFT_305287 [Daphnia pulex]|uniref:Uridine 5'-monophosphate synthase n=1 Tax=Daphnia pulex TaxID=6669 RepID=E9GRD4_DAPPU|nr:hypothetical protein DAPPUDRAFT_305287 [Daphnia pulex]|eukprot:EFX78014.1 hypothetical protein DAPPUDRAFT_305287 [Daphnia pulex]
MDELATKLFDIQAVKFGSFTLKGGQVSPIYFDFRLIISYPAILEKVAGLLWKKCAYNANVDLICGVPYTALPIATLISVTNRVPMLLRRKEAKDYGTKKLIEGDFRPGMNCIIVEDVVTTGTSVLETAVELRKLGILVTHAIVLLDRRQGGKENLAKHGIELSAVFHVEEIMASLEKQSKVDHKVAEEVMDFIRGHQQSIVSRNPRLHESLEERRSSSKHPIATRLFELMMAKKSNLCVAADLTSLDEVIKLAESIGPKIVVLKIHVDILEDFSLAKMKQLRKVAKAHEFLIMEDRKFADIANTVQQQFHGGVYKISEWADLITAHPLAGPEMITHLFGDSSSDSRRTCGCVLILEMSTKNALTSQDYSKEAAKWGLIASDIVAGFVGQSPPDADFSGWIQFTPGVNSASKSGDSKGQQYCSPAEAVLERGADIIIVGRGLIKSSDVVATAENYRSEGWTALTKRITNP